METDQIKTLCKQSQGLSLSKISPNNSLRFNISNKNYISFLYIGTDSGMGSVGLGMFVMLVLMMLEAKTKLLIVFVMIPLRF